MATQLGILGNKRWLYASGVTDPVEPEGLLRSGSPTSSNTKIEIQSFLDSKGIEYDKGDTKADLLALVEEE